MSKGPSDSRYWRPDNDEVSNSEKLLEKAKKAPFIPIGIAGFIAALAIGAYGYRNRDPYMTTSRYLMRLRVISQSMVVGAICIGLGYQIYNEHKDKK
ncbi:HIG1 domain family member 1A, mitochondrial isoform X1 [Hydra vulgaris]|uniref:HIG1 domain family member 1A, mitochondrial isoform X1 n=1 Tax=Hydra vulgaris TaxID=6087 RepID=UPI001F5E5B16|nr:HIG1 domain family member 1A, mitochondrial-like [Hydra vulgaris]